VPKPMNSNSDTITMQHRNRSQPGDRLWWSRLRHGSNGGSRKRTRIRVRVT